MSLDVPRAGLPEQDIATFPDIDPFLVMRADLNGSPGWVYGGIRWLLASAPLGKISEIPWNQKSPTKQRVAQQTNIPSEQPTLFDYRTTAEQNKLIPLASEVKLDLQTLIVAHALDAEQGKYELTLGQSRWNIDGGPAWHWLRSILRLPLTTSDRLQPAKPEQPDIEDVPAAPVQLRRPTAEQHDQRKEL